MAAESDGGIDDMVSVEEQPIDLSKVPKKPIPPLIPISFLRSGYHSFAQEPNRQVPRLYPIKNDAQEKRENWTANSRESVDENGVEGTRKRVRRANEMEHPRWGSQKLDRARSVPQLNPLTSTLHRNKSMSESRIPSVAANGLAGFDSEERLQAALEVLNQRPSSQVNDQLLQSSWIYIGYYSQLLHRFQAQEMLRQFALNSERDGNTDEQITDGAAGPPQGDTAASEDAADLKRRQTRPLTGKHVRTGTGASPATLLTLRRKIQARRQQRHDPQTSS